MRLLVWVLRALVFFTLFAFAAGCAIGVLAMVPRWWRQSRTVAVDPAAASAADAPAGALPGAAGHSRPMA